MDLKVLKLSGATSGLGAPLSAYLSSRRSFPWLNVNSRLCTNLKDEMNPKWFKVSIPDRNS